jgi:hypothetical protein
MDNHHNSLNQSLDDLLNSLNHLNLSHPQTNLSDLNQINHLQNLSLDPINSFNSSHQLNPLNQDLNNSLNSLNPLSSSDHNLVHNSLTNTLDHHTSKVVLNYCDDDHKTYTTINDYGLIYKHTNDGNNHLAGKVEGRAIYNNSGFYLGYGGQDGYIYHKGNCEDYKVGYVDSHGRIYRYDHGTFYDTHHTTSKGIIGGAVYMLIVEYGGVN